MTSRGYVLISVNNDVDYSRLAYACALSIKHSQPQGYNHVTVFTNDVDSFSKYQNKQAIDSLVEYNGPLGMDSRSRVYDLTPYEETIFLDADMLILDSLLDIWEHVSDHYLYVASEIVNFKNQVVTTSPYRKLFEQYQLPHLYNAFTYFKKSDPRTKEFFDLVKMATDEPRAFIKEFLPGSTLLTLPTDEAFSLVAKILDIDEEITDSVVKITHMKPAIQGWRNHNPNWTTNIRLTMDQYGTTRIGVWPQHRLLHYVDKTAIDDTLLATLEGHVC